MPKAAIIGCDETAAGWAARFALNGWEVAVLDPRPQAPARLEGVLARARRWLPALSEAALPPEGRVAFVQNLRNAMEDADHVHVSGEESSGFARDTGLPPGPCALVRGAVLKVEACNPVWLLPLVRLTSCGACPADALGGSAGEVSAPGVPALARQPEADRSHPVPAAEPLDFACTLFTALGMAPVLEAPGEAPRAGWEPARPALTPEAVTALGPGLLAAAGGLEGEARDAALAGLLRSLKERDLGTGRILAAHDARLRAAAPLAAGDPVRMQVLPAWIDYNGHMTESRYLYACSETTDAFLRRIGAGLDYVATGYSYYSAETHIRHLGESKLGDWLTGSVQVLAADAKRLHLFVTLRRGEQVVATLEQMLLHVDMRANRACAAHPAVLARLLPAAEAHKALPRPEAAGRRVGERRGQG